MSVRSFNADQLAEWLTSYCDLGEHAKTLKGMDLDGKTLCAMGIDDLPRLGLNMAEFTKILRKVKEYEQEQGAK